MFSRIVVTLDDSERAEAAPAAARALAERFGSQLVLLRVATWPAYLIDVAEAYARLDHYAAQLRAAGCSVRTVVHPDIAEDGIGAVAREEAPDLIVLAPHRNVDRKRLSHLLCPSVSAQMVSHAPIPFLIVPEPPHAARAVHVLAGTGSAGPVVLALDGDTIAEQAIPVAVKLARDLAQHLIFVCVVASGELRSQETDSARARSLAAQALLAAEQAALEDVADRVLRGVPIPVLLTRAPKQAKEPKAATAPVETKTS